MSETNRTLQRNLTDALNTMRDRGKPPRTIRVLNSWIDHMQNEMCLEKTERLAWLVASTIASAKLQQVLDREGNPRFLMKGGTLLQHRLDLAARSTMDLTCDYQVAAESVGMTLSLEEAVDEANDWIERIAAA